MAFSKARRLGDLVTNTDGDLTAVDDINTSKLIASTKIGSGPSITPSNFLHAKSDADGSGITIQRDSTSAGTYAQLSFMNTTTDNFTAPTWIRTIRDSGGVNASPMTFGTTGTERMRIDGSGNVMIGGTTAYGGADMITLGTGGFQQIRNTSAGCLELRRDSSFGPIMTLEKDGTANGVLGAYTTSRMYIGSGDTGIVFAPDYDSIYPVNPSTPTSRDNAIDLGYLNVRFDDVYATNGTIQTSDQNEKNTITNSDLGLDFVKRLSPKSYKFNGKTRIHYGLIAQDVETVLSDINKSTTDFAGFIKGDVSEEQDGSSYRYGLRYNEFIAPLIKAIQEQQTIIDDLKTRIETLEG